MPQASSPPESVKEQEKKLPLPSTSTRKRIRKQESKLKDIKITQVPQQIKKMEKERFPEIQEHNDIIERAKRLLLKRKAHKGVSQGHSPVKMKMSKIIEEEVKNCSIKTETSTERTIKQILGEILIKSIDSL